MNRAALLFLITITASPLLALDTAAVRCAHDVFGSVSGIWPRWTDAPFSVLIVEEDAEYLLGASSVPAAFERLPKDADGFTVHRRKRTFAPNLLATFPAFSAEPTIVVGTPQATGKNRTAWIFTLLHEHFHQWQQSRPGYYDAANALNLAHGDTTGMWMLNYDFPYADKAVQEKYGQFSRALAAAVRARGTAGFAAALRDVKTTWRTFREALSKDDYAYFRFQAWQEGVARYTELMAATQASSDCLRDASPSAQQLADRVTAEILASLESRSLGEQKRIAFYAAGAAIALVLDETSPSWKGEYFRSPFLMESYFAP